MKYTLYFSSWFTAMAGNAISTISIADVQIGAETINMYGMLWGRCKMGLYWLKCGVQRDRCE